ncbi:putative serine/threonine protein kinase [Desulfosarcina variabilis str. Montpellier]|uniref:hypothetical protein n=1 Tax=Desulfosarcina variabilis TaxID=2300 RepID=UPI003AFB6C30
MKKWIVLIAFSVCCAAAISFIKIDQAASKKVIYIKGGDPVLADRVSQSDQFIIYEADGGHGMFMKDDVTSVGTIQVQKKTSMLNMIDRTKQQVMADMGFSATVIHAADSRLLVFLIALGLTSGIMQLTLLLVTMIKTHWLASPAKEQDSSDADKNSVFTPDDEETSEYRDLVLFFLKIFKLQNGLGSDAVSRFSIDSTAAPGKRKVFELGVKGNSDWINRRMSIAPLGEDSGSKSKCYYVIYDTHMVVKIPPERVTDIAKYINDIRREVQITSQLAPMACIVPMVSVILKKIQKLPFEKSLTQEQLEKQYIRMVEEKPEYQDYLKIGDCFAFFMELTNNFFLGSVIDELHKQKNEIGEEIRESPEVAWNQEAFTTRYGLESLPVFESLQTLYRRCETQALQVIKETGQDTTIHQFHLKNWFLACITGEDLQGTDKDVDADLLVKIKKEFSTIFKANPKQVNDLVRLLKTQLATKTFLKSRQQIQNVASNMLTLLCQLKEKRIALRDLKPDNLFLDAAPDNYPVFLNDLSSFSIGVIDVETAVSLVPKADGSIAQPLIGGTPLYATPLHLLKNQTISKFFGDLPEALHLEDWFATIAIIFRAITGKNLFPRAARTFPALLKILKSSRNRSAPDEATVKKMSRTFWSAAVVDMKKQLTAFSDILNRLTVLIPEEMQKPIKSELEREKACLSQAIQKHISLFPLTKSQKNKAFLVSAAMADITKQIDRWENTDKLPEQHRQIAPQMVSFLKNLNRLKKGEKEKRDAVSSAAMSPCEISAYSLIEAMFQIAFRAMYKSPWKALTKPTQQTEEKIAVKDDRDLVTTIISTD